MTMSKLEDEKLIEQIINLVRQTNIPVSIDFVAKNLGLNWSSARALLMQLSLEGLLKATKTTKGWIFSEVSR